MSAADEMGLDAWMCRTAEPTAGSSATSAPHALDGLASMSWGQLRDALIVEHNARQLAELQRNAAQSAHTIEADAHKLTLDALIAQRDQCDALRTAVGMAENVIATLRARVAELEAPIARRWTITPAEGAGAALLVTTDRICPSDPCWIARRGDDTALGETEREAVERLAGRLGYVVATVAPVAALTLNDAAVDAIDRTTPRRVPSLCRDCHGDGVVNDAECAECNGEGCRS